ncbi:hypothetical protein HPB51_017810 [Rhipicephalus microplus]|uniref:Peptidase M13 C-terminal domain-containing protein n=1 Tax=Rhipicephalus microplus TaxID=6941 RepID=A0A9J6DX09_RHIMP|nr:hypothetical protein HPB51_017810 [Rhipicephalus microplus]
MRENHLPIPIEEAFFSVVSLQWPLPSQSVRGTEQPRLKGMEQFTGEQVFFMTMCLSLCQEDGPLRSSPPCNAAVRNFAPFATAFNCSRRSAMNPAKKCHLLAGQ